LLPDWAINDTLSRRKVGRPMHLRAPDRVDFEAEAHPVGGVADGDDNAAGDAERGGGDATADIPPQEEVHRRVEEELGGGATGDVDRDGEGWLPPPPQSLTNSFYPAQLAEVDITGSEAVNALYLDNPSVTRLVLTESPWLSFLELSTPQLQQLDISGSTRLRRAILRSLSARTLNFSSCPHLAKLSVTSVTLQTLSLEGCRELADFRASLPLLRTLEASYCASLNARTLGDVLRSTTCLTSLSLRYCDAFGLEDLEDLLVGDVRHLRLLKSLDVSFTCLGARADRMCLALTSLESLDIGGCRGFGDAQALALVAAQPKHLRSLNVSHCESLGPSGLSALVTAASDGSLPGLKKLLANSCEGAVQDEFFALLSRQSASRALQGGITSLSVVGCALLKDPVFDPVDAQSHALARLVTLNAHYCRRLRSIYLASLPRLRDLHLSSGESLTTFGIRDCPSLQSLVLRDCPELQPKALDDFVQQKVDGHFVAHLDVDVARCDKLQAASLGEPGGAEAEGLLYEYED